jgi:short chain dehydrogenase
MEWQVGRRLLVQAAVRGWMRQELTHSIHHVHGERVAMKLEAGKVGVVTGEASGIGLALAERFARDGLDVVLADLERPALESAAERIGALGVETLAVRTNVSECGSRGPPRR